MSADASRSDQLEGYFTMVSEPFSLWKLLMIEDDKAGDNKVEEFALVPEELKSVLGYQGTKKGF